MSKKIIFCADGTWNRPGEPDDDDSTPDPSNVYKIFLKLCGDDDPHTTRLANEQEKTLRAADGSVIQVAKYLHGVGDSKNFLVQVLGGGFGEGLITRIVRGYTLSLREKEFVESARAAGASNSRILATEILPNLIGPLIVYSTLLRGIHDLDDRAFMGRSVLAEGGATWP